jgi:predicted negative regulator of RcsB-dependent stress response
MSNNVKYIVIAVIAAVAGFYGYKYYQKNHKK